LPGLQPTFCVITDNEGGLFCGTMMFVFTLEQLLASVTVREYVPLGILFLSSVVMASFQTYVNGMVPPLTIISICPSLPGLQLGDSIIAEMVGASGFTTLNDCVAVQLLASVTVKL
jgi:hypothetical protein